MNHEFTFKLSIMPPINGALRRALSKVNCKWSGSTLQGVADYEQLCDLHLELAKAVGISNVEVLAIKSRESDSEPEVLPKAIGFPDLPAQEKQLLISTAITSTVAIRMMSTLLGCTFDEAANHISSISSAQFQTLTPEQIEDAVAALAKELHEQPNKSVFDFEI